jgi:hypothetical protein
MNSNQQITIKAAFYDSISSIIEDSKIDVPEWFKTKEVICANDNTKEYIIECFQKCLSFEITEDGIVFQMKKNQKEISDFFEDRKSSLEYEVRRLKKWCDTKEEDKKQIFEYLEFKKLFWIIEKIK